MQRKVTFRCENCGREFANGIECQQHEKTCKNRRYLIEQLKHRLRKYLESIETQGFDVSVRYDSTTNSKGVCLIAITDQRGRKKQ